jgi:hypothetical protein
MNVAELEAALKAAKEQEKQVGEEAWKDLTTRAKGQLDWSVKWEDQYTVYISARYKQSFLDEMEALDKLYPHSYSRIYDDNRKWRGMAYMLIGNILVQSGGGWMILDIPRKTAFRDWRELTQEQADSIRAGTVPDDIKSEWSRP